MATATDPDVPPQTLAFSLAAGGLSGASINASSGVFTWPTTNAPAPSTNTLTVRVTDNGVPNLSDSETITVVVLGRLDFGQLSRNGNQLTLSWNSAPGQTYRVEYKDDLGAATWSVLGADLMGTGSPVSTTVNVSNPPHRFYRLRLVE